MYKFCIFDLNYKVMRKFGYGCISLAFVAIAAVSCNKEKFSGRATARMTDNPALYLQVNVDVREFQVHYDDEDSASWLVFDTKAGVYNLIDLTGGVTVVLAEEAELPVGKITQMRLLLGTNNSIMLTDSSTFALEVPSGQQSGFKINVNEEIEEDQEYEFLIDFDASQSIVVTGNGKYQLKPVIKLVK